MTKKNFVVTGKRLFNLSRQFLLQIDFARHQLQFRKEKQGHGVVRVFRISQCSRLLPNAEVPTELEIVFVTSSSLPLSSQWANDGEVQGSSSVGEFLSGLVQRRPAAAALSAESPDEKRGGGAAAPDGYKKVVHFANGDERTQFVRLMRACNVLGPEAFRIFAQLDDDGDHLLMPHQAAAALTRYGPELLGKGGSASDDLLSRQSGISFVQLLLYVAAAREECGLSPSSTGPVELGEDMSAVGSARDPCVTPAPILSELLSARDEMTSADVHGAAADSLAGLHLLPRESVLLRHAAAARLDTAGSDGPSRGSLYLTNYRVAYRAYQTLARLSLSLDIPLGTIRSVDLANKSDNVLLISTKDARSVCLALDASGSWVSQFLVTLRREAFPEDQTKTFAFALAAPTGSTPDEPRIHASLDGWNVYDPTREYERVGLVPAPPGSPLADKFRLSFFNAEFEAIPSYPQFFLVPAAMSDEELADVCKYRSSGRLPATTWLHPVTAATLSRCSQPLVGLRFRRCEADEKLINLLRQANPTNSSVLYIVDARPYKAAVGNQMMGKGFENTDNYPGTSIRWAGIDNIHAIRQSWQALTDLLSTETDAEESSFFSRLEQTQWTQYVRNLLDAADDIARVLEVEGASVLIHCSDGWDRTSQLSSLAQLLLDPYFRTLRGFCALVEKEWLSFGHKFAERYGHASANTADQQRSPIFHHWCDAVFQVMRQFPLSFEFNDGLLVFMLDHVTSCRFGTFLFDCQRERSAASLSGRTTSIWSHVLADESSFRFTNPLYSGPDRRRLVPSSSPRRFVLWERYWMRHLAKPGGPCSEIAEDAAVDLALRYRLLQRAVSGRGLSLDEFEDDAEWERREFESEGGDLRYAAGSAPGVCDPSCSAISLHAPVSDPRLAARPNRGVARVHVAANRMAVALGRSAAAVLSSSDPRLMPAAAGAPGSARIRRATSSASLLLPFSPPPDELEDGEVELDNLVEADQRLPSSADGRGARKRESSASSTAAGSFSDRSRHVPAGLLDSGASRRASSTASVNESSDTEDDDVGLATNQNKQ